MGVTLGQNTIRELAATIASEVVKTLSEAQLVNDTRAVMAKVDEPVVLHVGPITVDLGRREASARGRALNVKPARTRLPGRTCSKHWPRA